MTRLLLPPRPRAITRPTRPASSRRPTGFSLVELLVSFAILIIILLALLALFDFNRKLARAQTHVADMQQNLRITQHTLLRDVRMAGRGGMPRGQYAVDGGLAVAVRNDVPDGATISTENGASPAVLEGTDVLTIRGVISTPIYQVEPVPGALSLDDPDNPASGTVRIVSPNPTTGIVQDFGPILEVLDDPEAAPALILVSPLDDAIYAVVEIEPNSCVDSSCLMDVNGRDVLTLRFLVTGGQRTADYLALSPGGVFPPALTTVAVAGLLEEHRFYIREEYEVPGDQTSGLAPVFSRARFFPGTEDGLPGERQNDVAENVLDLQVALGIDTDGDEQIQDDGSDADDWLFNSPADDVVAQSDKWDGVTLPRPNLYYVRVTTVTRTDAPDRGHVDDPILAIEDHLYNESPAPADEENRLERMFRRRLIQTVIDLRNVS